MKRIITVLMALCMLAGVVTPAFAESDPQFPWGISCDEYISGYQISEYETKSLNEYATVIHMAYTDTDAEDLVFYNDQFVGTMYDYTGDNAAMADTLRQLLGSLVGATGEGGSERVFAIMDIIVPDLYSSAADFTECVYAEGADGVFGAVCSYKDTGYVLLIVNETLLHELHAANTAKMPIGSGPIGSNITSGGAASETEAEPVMPPPSAAPGGGFSVGGGLSTGESLPDDDAPSAGGSMPVGGFSVGGGLTDGNGLSAGDELPVDDSSVDDTVAGSEESYSDLLDYIRSTGLSVYDGFAKPEAGSAGNSIGGSLSGAIAMADDTDDLVLAAGIEYPWGAGVREYKDYSGGDYESFELDGGITCLYRYNSEDEYELCVFASDQFVANLLEFYSAEDTDPDMLLARFGALFGWYSAADVSHVAEIVNSMLPLGITDDDISHAYCAEMGGNVYAYCFLYDGCADIIVVNEALLKSAIGW